mmetsp:Transcript_54701/g.133751  ORF Transcript_54701/g.133751 Transcript_54701/m.133751 type:complete len:250 (-) Transcript_54701:793-1542(-)
MWTRTRRPRRRILSSIATQTLSPTASRASSPRRRRWRLWSTSSWTSRRSATSSAAAAPSTRTTMWTTSTSATSTSTRRSTARTASTPRSSRRTSRGVPPYKGCVEGRRSASGGWVGAAVCASTSRSSRRTSRGIPPCQGRALVRGGAAGGAAVRAGRALEALWGVPGGRGGCGCPPSCVVVDGGWYVLSRAGRAAGSTITDSAPHYRGALAHVPADPASQASTFREAQAGTKKQNSLTKEYIFSTGPIR